MKSEVMCRYIRGAQPPRGYKSEPIRQHGVRRQCHWMGFFTNCSIVSVVLNHLGGDGGGMTCDDDPKADEKATRHSVCGLSESMLIERYPV